MQSRRSLKNLLSSPEFQLKYWLYYLSFGFFAYCVIVLFLFLNVSQMMRIMTNLSATYAEVGLSMNRLTTQLMYLLLGGGITMIISSFVVALILTHRVVGPIYKLREHIQALKKGDFKHKTHLRKYDELKSLANDLNELSETLAKKQ